jgi:hypothetical protein
VQTLVPTKRKLGKSGNVQQLKSLQACIEKVMNEAVSMKKKPHIDLIKEEMPGTWKINLIRKSIVHEQNQPQKRSAGL